MDEPRFDKHVNHMVLTQYKIKKGLQIFEKEGVDAVSKQELVAGVVDPLDPLHVTNNSLCKQKLFTACCF